MKDLYNKNIQWLRQNSDKCHINRVASPYNITYMVIDSKEPEQPSLVAIIETKPSNTEQPTQKATYSIHSQLYPTKEAEKIVENFITEIIPPPAPSIEGKEADTIIILGLGLGYIPTKFREKYPNKRLILIEPDISVFYLAIRHCDLNFINFDQIYIGYEEAGLPPPPSPTLVCEAALPVSEGAGGGFSIYTHKSSERLYPALYTRIINFLNKKPTFQVPDQWKYKKFASEQCRIIFIDSSYVLTKECLSAIQKTGNVVHYIHIDLDNYDYDMFVRRLMNDIAHFKPDFVLTINHLGFDKEGRLTELFSQMELPFVSWFVDSPNVVLSSYDHNISDWCNLFVWDDDYIAQIKEKGYPHCDYLPLATDPAIFYPKDTPYLYPVSFVGSSMSFAIHKNMRSWCHRDDLLKAFPDIVADFLQSRRDSLHSTSDKQNNTVLGKNSHSAFHISHSELSFDSPEQKEDFHAAILWRATQIYRQSGIDKLTPFMPTLAGDPNWSNILPFEFQILSERWYYENLCDFYNQTKINFNMTSLQMKHAVNQRLFDVSACKKFILTDYRKQIDELFDGKENIVYFTDVEEIPSLVDFYLKNDTEREKYCNKAYTLVLNKHTYQHRIKVMIEVLRKRYR